MRPEEPHTHYNRSMGCINLLISQLLFSVVTDAKFPPNNAKVNPGMPEEPSTLETSKWSEIEF